MTDPVAHHDHAVRVVRGLPTNPEALGPGLLDQILQRVDDASREFDALAAALPPNADVIPEDAFDDPGQDRTAFTRDAITRGRSLLAMVHVEMKSARGRVHSLLRPGSFPLPKGTFALPNADPIHLPSTNSRATLLASGWTEVTAGVAEHGGAALLRHPSGAMAWHGQHGHVELLEGNAALSADVRFGWRLPDQTPVERALRAGTELDVGLGTLRAMGWRWREIAIRDAGNGRDLLLALVHPPGPLHRCGLVWAVVDANEVVKGHGVLEGAVAFDQVLRLAMSGDVRTDHPTIATLAAAAAAARPLAEQLSELLSDPAAFVAAVRPRPGDAGRAFSSEVATAMEARSTSAWELTTPQMQPLQGQSGVIIDVCPSGGFAGGLPAASAFAETWQAMDRWLLPGRWWATWCYHAPGHRDGRRYDGLVWLDDHWAWFPKPWRMLPTEIAGR